MVGRCMEDFRPIAADTQPIRHFSSSDATYSVEMPPRQNIHRPQMVGIGSLGHRRLLQGIWAPGQLAPAPVYVGRGVCFVVLPGFPFLIGLRNSRGPNAKRTPKFGTRETNDRHL